ncbi:MAG: acyltransferase [Candidatus Dormibacter sp.]
MKTAQPLRLGHRPALDGLRAIAVVAVLCNHAWAEQPPFAGGQIGVDIFFVLSGFLITTLIAQENRTAGRVQLRNFYGRRALRILPVLIVVVCVAELLATVVGSPANHVNTVRAAPEALLFFQNWDLALHQGSLLGGYLGHTWSLSIEEQFYLVWPIALIALLRFSDTRTALKVCVALAVAGQLLSLVLSMGDRPSSYFVYFGTPTHGSVLLIGCALALLVVEQRPSVSASTVLCAAVFTALALAVAPPGPLPELAAALCACVLILRAISDRPTPFFNNEVVRWIGRRSYGMYLWGLAIDAAVGDLGIAPGPLRLLIDLPLTIVVAQLSLMVIERPFLTLKGRFPAEQGHRVRAARLTALSPAPALAPAADTNDA